MVCSHTGNCILNVRKNSNQSQISNLMLADNYVCTRQHLQYSLVFWMGRDFQINWLHPVHSKCKVIFQSPYWQNIVLLVKDSCKLKLDRIQIGDNLLIINWTLERKGLDIKDTGLFVYIENQSTCLCLLWWIEHVIVLGACRIPNYPPSEIKDPNYDPESSEPSLPMFCISKSDWSANG